MPRIQVAGNLAPARTVHPAAAALLVALLTLAANAQEWAAALRNMPLPVPVAELNRTNCVEIMLAAFHSNAVVKALIFMPGATDEFYMFRRARAKVTAPSPSLLDALRALTNQTLIRATFRSPFLLLHTAEDPLEPEIAVEDTRTAERFKRTSFPLALSCNDRDWDFVQPLLKWRLKADVRPWCRSTDSWHFYRHSFAACGLSDWEVLESVALAGKSKFVVRRNRVVFEPDSRMLAVPKFEVFPR